MNDVSFARRVVALAIRPCNLRQFMCVKLCVRGRVNIDFYPQPTSYLMHAINATLMNQTTFDTRIAVIFVYGANLRGLKLRVSIAIWILESDPCC